MDSIYLSSTHPRLHLTSEADLRNALAAELLEENHFMDLKREIKVGRAQNKETARDLAQFAIDGGTVIVGLEESDSGTVELAPQPLKGLAERIEQIAMANCDPPLAVVCRPIETAADPLRGYLVAHVPASPSAPHMVDGRYLGRGDKTKRYLADAEVRRLHAQRSTLETDGTKLLHAEFERDLFDVGGRRQAHGFFLAEPVTGRRGMMLSLTDPPADWQKVLAFTQRAYGPDSSAQRALMQLNSGGFAPDINTMQTFDRRTRGLALSTTDIEPGRRMRDQARVDGTAGELEIRDDGGLRLYLSSLSQSRTDTAPQQFFEIKAVGLAHRLVSLTVATADEGGYMGNWVLAFGATGLRGTHSFHREQNLDFGTTPYTEDRYTESVIASYADLIRRPRSVVDQLVGGLLRGFATRQEFLPALTDPSEQPTDLDG